MTEKNKKIASLALAASLLISATGCSTNTIERNIENNKVTYEGIIDLKGLDNLYVIEIKDLKEEKKLYLCKRGGEKFTGGHNYKLLGTDILLAQSNNTNVFNSEYGDVINVLPYKQFWAVYVDDVTKNEEITNYYDAQEILDIFECVKNDYETLIRNEKVKKLELK